MLDKDKIINIIIAVLAVLLLVGAYVISVFSSESARLGENFRPVTIYFVNAERNSLEPETRYIERGSMREEVESVLIELISGPVSPNLFNSIPTYNFGSHEYSFIYAITTVVREEYATSCIVEIFFSDEFNEYSPAEVLLLKSALVYSFTELDFVESVRFYVGGEELRRRNGELVGAMNRENVYVNAILLDDVTFQTITLYFAKDFPNESRFFLVREEREVEVSNRPIEHVILEELIKGPQTPGLVSFIPSETQINDITIYERVFYIDLNDSFLSRMSVGNSAISGIETFNLAVFSIVNSLTEISEINLRRVQFYIDAQIIEGVYGGVDITQIIERNEDIIGE
ncbi:MAG: GerMN domain-containing protein [Defluviitaleaceae bacterium]|nr:GerMN domain-containing protein [Defluviitaleaceae bacterium]